MKFGILLSILLVLPLISQAQNTRYLSEDVLDEARFLLEQTRIRHTHKSENLAYLSKRKSEILIHHGRLQALEWENSMLRAGSQMVNLQNEALIKVLERVLNSPEISCVEECGCVCYRCTK